jgi:hypothetical protein
MKKFDKLLHKLKEYNLEPGTYTVYGSAPLVVINIVNDVNDFDVIVKPENWIFDKPHIFRDGDFEFFDEWFDGDSADKLISNSFQYRGVLFVDPRLVIEYKKKLRRGKDKTVWDTEHNL